MNTDNDACHRPEDVEELKSLWKQRWLWWLLTWAFLIPGLFFQVGPIKRLKEARENVDVEAGREAIAKMKRVTAVCVPIGVILMLIYFGGGFYRH